MFEVIFMFLSIFVMSAIVGWCITYGIWMNHKEKMAQVQTEQLQIHVKRELLHEAMEKGILNPSTIQSSLTSGR